MPTDPFRNFKFEVEIDGFTRAGFQKVAGLKNTTGIIEYREGGRNESPEKLSGQSNTENVTLTRGMSNDEDFLNWRNEVYNPANVNGEQGPDDDYRRDVTVYLKNKSGSRVLKWKIGRAWPSEFETADLDASAEEVLLTNLVLANESIDGPIPV